MGTFCAIEVVLFAPRDDVIEVKDALFVTGVTDVGLVDSPWNDAGGGGVKNDVVIDDLEGDPKGREW